MLRDIREGEDATDEMNVVEDLDLVPAFLDICNETMSQHPSEPDVCAATLMQLAFILGYKLGKGDKK